MFIDFVINDNLLSFIEPDPDRAILAFAERTTISVIGENPGSFLDWFNIVIDIDSYYV